MLHRERDACQFTLQSGRQFRALAAQWAGYSSAQNPDTCAVTLLFTLIEYLSQNLLGSEPEGMFKNADAEEGQSRFLVLRKAKC